MVVDFLLLTLKCLNYDIKKLAINSLTHRIYPNFVNGDYKQVIEDPDDYNTFFATMG